MLTRHLMHSLATSGWSAYGSRLHPITTCCYHYWKSRPSVQIWPVSAVDDMGYSEKKAVILPFRNIFSFSFSFSFLELHSHSDAIFILAFRDTRQSSDVRIIFLFLAVRSPQTDNTFCVSLWCRHWHQIHSSGGQHIYTAKTNLKRFHFVLSF